MVALLTSLPRREEQSALMAEVSRVLAPCGLVYLSDVPLQWDLRNIERYRQEGAEFGELGVLMTMDGNRSEAFRILAQKPEVTGAAA